MAADEQTADRDRAIDHLNITREGFDSTLDQLKQTVSTLKNNNAEDAERFDITSQKLEDQIVITDNGFKGTLSTLNLTAKKLEVAYRQDSIRFNKIAENFVKQLDQFASLDQEIDALREPLFPISVIFELRVNPTNVDPRVAENIHLEIKKIQKLKKSLSNEEFQKQQPRYFALDSIRGKPVISFTNVVPELAIREDGPYREIYSHLVYSYLPNIILHFYKDSMPNTIGYETADISLVLNDIGTIRVDTSRGDVSMSIFYTEGQPLKVKVEMNYLSFVQDNKRVSSMLDLTNGYVVKELTYDNGTDMFGSCRLTQLKLIPGGNPHHVYKLNFGKKHLQIRSKPKWSSEMFIMTGREALESRERWTY